MPVRYKIFKAWHELDAEPNIKDFMAYQVEDGLIVALSYPDMLRLFRENSKNDIVKKNAILTCGLDNALSCNISQGEIDV